ncbi:MAG: glycosyltransferase family 2 protein [Janthinobacterium lividum]
MRCWRKAPPLPDWLQAGGDAVPVAILLSTYNGERFLPEQLDSLLAQTHTAWTVFWRDDGSSDGTVAVLDAFARGPGLGRCVALGDARGHIGATASFLTLLRGAPPGVVVAFADQDDVWLPHKLARGLEALRGAGDDRPALYFARQILVDERLQRLGLSFRLRRAPDFLASLTQNVATGCTMMLNPPAAGLVARSRAPLASLHDWWSYLLVAGADGRLLVDDTPVVLYRQHASNAVGAPLSLSRRGLAALRRGPDVFMGVFRSHLATLLEQPELLSPQARRHVEVIAGAMQGGPGRRLVALRLKGLRRQTWQETLLFRAWFLIG